MADLTDLNSAQSTKIIGADSSGVEQTPVQSTSNGGLHTNLRNNAGTEIGTSSDPVRIDPTGTTAQPITDNAGSLTVDNPTASNFNAQVVGNVADAATDSGNPVKIGGIFNTTPPLLTNGQRGNNILDENSNQVNIPNSAMFTQLQKTYSATNTTALTVGTSETSIFLFKNPNANTVKAKIIKIVCTGTATFRLYHTPTITSNGTSITPINQKIMTSPASATITPFQSPTLSANGTFMWPITVTAQTGTVPYLLEHQLILNPNFNINITAQAGSNNTPVNVTIFWCEVQ